MVVEVLAGELAPGALKVLLCVRARLQSCRKRANYELGFSR